MLALPPVNRAPRTPLHGFRLRRPERWACLHARPSRDDVYDWRCPHCVAAARVRVHEMGDEVVFFWFGGRAALVRLSELIERAERALRGEHGH